ncbi:MAG: putative toxin-antitoxin system toxin component, PIN family [Delftia acidovorans]|nr:putative toxin-antitoxin system toxin component, PIN family [Delftia acidovorans]
MRTDLRLVIDTNLWISRLLMPGGAAAKAVDQALGCATVLMSQETQAELSEVLLRPKFDRYVSREDRQRFLLLLDGVVRWVSITRKVSVCRDPKDDKFLDIALNGAAQMIVTGDQDLLVLHPFHGVEILKPADFLDRAAR